MPCKRWLGMVAMPLIVIAWLASIRINMLIVYAYFDIASSI